VSSQDWNRKRGYLVWCSRRIGSWNLLGEWLDDPTLPKNCTVPVQQGSPTTWDDALSGSRVAMRVLVGSYPIDILSTDRNFGSGDHLFLSPDGSQEAFDMRSGNWGRRSCNHLSQKNTLVNRFLYGVILPGLLGVILYVWHLITYNQIISHSREIYQPTSVILMAHLNLQKKASFLISSWMCYPPFDPRPFSGHVGKDCLVDTHFGRVDSRSQNTICT